MALIPGDPSNIQVGHLQLFNPMAPDGVYQLNLGDREQHIVAQMCVQLSVMEEGDNCIDEFFGDTTQTMKPFVTPRSWLETVPGILLLLLASCCNIATSCGPPVYRVCCSLITLPSFSCVATPLDHGTWQFTYSTDPEFEDWALRRKIAVEYLGWQFPDVEDGADQSAPPKSLRRNV